MTIPAFEWHGNRTQWGDHNVYYRDEGDPIDGEWDLPDLLDNVAETEALVIPHHTGYVIGQRGKDWDVFDPELMPVTEVYSSHGSSEAVGGPVGMAANRDMGPRTSGGTFRDALERGHRMGAIASNDGPGFPGTWGKGLTGLWTSELTREGVWEALQARRTYGVTGDRVRLWWTLDGHPMGSEVSEDVDYRASVEVDCPRPLNRIEVVHDGAVVAVHDHRLEDHDGADGGDDRYRALVEFGWGPSPEYGDFDDVECRWSGTIRADGGELMRAHPRFTGFGGRYELEWGRGLDFELRTSRADETGLLPEGQADRSRQGFVVEVGGDDETDIVVDLTNRDPITVPLRVARTESTVVPFLAESWDRLSSTFGLDRAAVDNPDVAYHNARKVRVSRAHPRAACRASVAFEDLPKREETDYYYVRVSQRNGQYAWSSPVWVGDE